MSQNHMQPELRAAYERAAKARRAGQHISLEDGAVLLAALQSGELRLKHVDFLHRGHTRPVHGVKPSAWGKCIKATQRKALMAKSSL